MTRLRKWILTVTAAAAVAIAGLELWPRPSDSATANLSLSVRGRRGAILVWEPSSLAFGDVDVGAYRDLTAVLRNTGQRQATGSIALGSQCESAYSILSGGGGFTLNPGQTRSVTIRATPPDTLSYPCVLTVGY